MARMHTRRRGKASSKRPYVTKNPGWVPISPSEIEKLVVEFGRKGMSTAMIGLTLRDQYGVPDVKLATNKSITKILKDNNIKFGIPEDLSNLIKHATKLQLHLENNPKDIKNKRAFQLIEAKIRRLTKYYKRKGTLHEDWKYK